MKIETDFQGMAGGEICPFWRNPVNNIPEIWNNNVEGENTVHWTQHFGDMVFPPPWYLNSSPTRHRLHWSMNL